MRNADKKDARCKRERKDKIKTEPGTRIASRLSLEGTVKIDIFERLTSHQYSTIIFLLL